MLEGHLDGAEGNLGHRGSGITVRSADLAQKWLRMCVKLGQLKSTDLAHLGSGTTDICNLHDQPTNLHANLQVHLPTHLHANLRVQLAMLICMLTCMLICMLICTTNLLNCKLICTTNLLICMLICTTSLLICMLICMPICSLI